MYAVIYGWGEGDSNLVESVLGVYDSIENIPNQYKIPKDKIDFLGICTSLSSKQMDMYSDYSGPSYIRFQEFEINHKIPLLDWIGRCNPCA